MEREHASGAVRFARLVYLIAGIYGVIVLTPGLFTEKLFSARYPPGVTHPEFYYGFYGVGLAWQAAFLIIASSPSRFRGIMPAAMLEKFSYAAACLSLNRSGRLAGGLAAFGMGDLILGALFVFSYFRLGRSGK